VDKDEKGIIGYAAGDNFVLPVQGWTINHVDEVVGVFFDSRRFCKVAGITAEETRKLLGTEWRLRLDNDEHIFHGNARCTTTKRMHWHEKNFPPTGSLASQTMHGEILRFDIALYFRFTSASFGPYHVAEAVAMARNGNDLFFDLLTVGEIDDRLASGDRRFSFRSPEHS
jgi:hypothetical protein